MTVQYITIRISDGIKTADYAPPKLYDLTASVQEPGEDITAEVDRVIAALSLAGERFLGRAAPKVDLKIETQQKPVGRKKAAPAEPKQIIAADPMAVEEDETHAGSSSTPEQAKADPMAVEDDWSAPATAEPAREITDADLNTATQRKNAELNAPDRIRELIASYNPDKTKTFQLRQIPQAQREDYLAKLALLSA